MTSTVNNASTLSALSALYGHLHTQKPQQQNTQAAQDSGLEQLLASILNTNAAGSTAFIQGTGAADNDGDEDGSGKRPCCGAASSAPNISGQNLMQLQNAASDPT